MSLALLPSCSPAASALAGDWPRFHPPITQEGGDTTPRPYTYVEPQPLKLPSAEDLKTIAIKGRKYTVTRVSPDANYGASVKHRIDKEGLAVYQNPNEALTFVGTGGGGRRSRERLLLEDCTFVIDFKEGDFSKWDERRCAVFVKGYREVVIRNCVFLAKGVPGEPDRRTMASVGVYDTLKTQIEDCYFEGLTNWMRGHVTIFDSGAVTLRRIEVSGTKLGDQYWCGGGLWVANGVGESKLGSAQSDEALRIYPSGPLLIEDCWVHDQQGNENTDGIYVQSIHPYLIRNCRVENWGKDGLLDLGFRDSARGTYKGKPLVNHGAIGVVENCALANGYVKCSVGLGGGLIFRNNLLRNVWLYPYVFDGGSWYVLNNKFTHQQSVLLSGREDQLGGWSAREGMLINGSKMYWYGNVIESKEGSAPRVLYVSSAAKPSNLKETVITDYNIYHLLKSPGLWADDQAQKTKYATIEEWRAIGKDKNSLLGGGTPGQLHPAELKLPGGLEMKWGGNVGLTGPVGVAGKDVPARGKALSKAFVAAFAASNKEPGGLTGSW